jgi:hypothetical protein
MTDWHPHKGQQIRFLGSPAFEALFGGAAGPGKTDCLIMEALRQIEHPLYTGILFRRTFPKLEQADGIIQRSLRWYPGYGGRYNASKHYWTFPSGARIYFGHLQRTDDMYQYQGAQFSFVGFDELTEFDRDMYLYLFTRCRPPARDLMAYIRAATNPGNVGHRWVKDRFVARDIVNRIRYFAPVQNDKGELIDTEVTRDYPGALSRAFYPAKMSDNPSGDPNYAQRILATADPVVVAQLVEGDWDAEHKQGLIFDTWSSTENVTADAEYRPDLPLYYACDDGYVYGEGPGYASYHPRVVLFVQDNELGGLDIVDEYVACEETHASTLMNVRGNADDSPTEHEMRWHHYPKPSVAYVPSEAALFKGELHKWGISTVNATHRVGEGIKAVRQIVKGGDGVRRIRVNPRCQHVIYEFGIYRADPNGRADTGEVVPLKTDDHTMDALRYLVFKRRHTTG